MNEQARLDMLDRINREKKRNQISQKVLRRLEELKSVPEVKEFLALQDKMQIMRKMNDEFLLSKERQKFSSYSCEKHDICLFVSNNDSHNLKAGYVEFCCLDCGYRMLVPTDNIDDFIKDRFIINLNNPLCTQSTIEVTQIFSKLRNYYFELLLNHDVAESFYILRQHYFDLIDDKAMK